MKKLKFLIIIFLILSNWISISFAQNSSVNWSTETKSSAEVGEKTGIKVLTTEKVPWYNCVCAVKLKENATDTERNASVNWYVEKKILDWNDSCQNTDLTKRKYICTAEEWFEWLQNSFREIIRWVVQISILLGVIWLAAFGVIYSVTWNWDSTYKKQLKEYITGLIVGLLILFFFRYILLGLAPWVFVN